MTRALLRSSRLVVFAGAFWAGALGALGACDAFDGEASSERDAAPVDAASPVEAGHPLTCPLGALLCDDFEREDLLLDGKWRVDGALARLALDPSVSTSPTRSLRADPVNGPGGALRFDVSAFDLKSIDVTFSLRTDSTDGDFTQVAFVEMDRATSFLVIEIRGDQVNLGEQYSVTDGGVVYDTRPVKRITPGAFVRYRLRIDRTSKTASFGVAGDTVATPRPLQYPHASITSVSLGAPFGGTRLSPHWIDDVVVSP